MNVKNKEALTLFQLINHVLLQHPEYADVIKNLAIQATGFSYDYLKNGEDELIRKIASIHPKIVFDVGANIGDWTNLALTNFNCAEIHAFELSPTTFQSLISKINNRRAKVNNFGLSDSNGTIQYKDYGPDSALNTILTASTYHDQNIPPQIVLSTVRTGDGYCVENNIHAIDFLKIDVEGAERRVLCGFSQLIKDKKIRCIQFEYGYSNGDDHFLMRDFFQFFQAFGYVVARVVKGSIQFRDWKYSDNDFTSGPNYVAIRADDKELLEILSKPTPPQP